MKLHKRITINGKVYPLIDDSTQLSLFSPGRAAYSVMSDTDALKGTVIFSMGYQLASIKDYFIGWIESSTAVDSKSVRIFCRELSAVLNFRLPMALRDVTMQAILDVITNKTGLTFSLPEQSKPYLINKAAMFYNIGSGYLALDSLRDVFGVPHFFWQQRQDGSIFVGSWDDSHWQSKRIDIARSLENAVSVSQGATIPVIVGLRPGPKYNGRILTDVAMSDTKMTLQWSQNPWGQS